MKKIIMLTIMTGLLSTLLNAKSYSEWEHKFSWTASSESKAISTAKKNARNFCKYREQNTRFITVQNNKCIKNGGLRKCTVYYSCY